MKLKNFKYHLSFLFGILFNYAGFYLININFFQKEAAETLNTLFFFKGIIGIVGIAVSYYIFFILYYSLIINKNKEANS